MVFSPGDQRRHRSFGGVANQLVFRHVVIGLIAAGHHDEVGGDLDGAMFLSMSYNPRPDL